MTLHSAKGLEFDTVFLPGWEEGLFPHQRTLDEQGRAGLEEERRLAYVGLTRARKRAKIYFASNRRMHGLWQIEHPVALPRRTARGRRRGDERGGNGGFGGCARLRRLALRRDDARSAPATPRRAGSARRRKKARRISETAPATRRTTRVTDEDLLDLADATFEQHRASGAALAVRLTGRDVAAPGWPRGRSAAAAPLTIEGELVAKSTGTVSDFARRRPRVPPEIRQRQRGRGRRQQAHHPVRQGRREARGG